MEIRRATERDAPAIRALIDLYVADGTLLPRTEEFIASHADHFVVAGRGDPVVGWAHLMRRGLAGAARWWRRWRISRAVAATEPCSRSATTRNSSPSTASSRDT